MSTSFDRWSGLSPSAVDVAAFVANVVDIVVAVVADVAVIGVSGSPLDGGITSGSPVEPTLIFSWNVGRPATMCQKEILYKIY